MAKSLEDQVHYSWLKIRQRIIPSIESSILPITTTSKKHRNSAYEYIGSSFLLSDGDRKYIVTARHVLDNALEVGAGAFTLNKENHLFHLGSDQACHAFYSENYDIALIDVTESNEFSSRAFIQYEDIVSVKELDRVFVCGFPVSKNKSLRYSAEFVPSGVLSRVVNPPHDFFENRKIDPQHSLFFDYSIDQFVNDDITEVSKIFSPKGLSGGPIFKIGTAKQILEGSINQVQCVGVFTNQKDNLAWGLNISSFMRDVIQNPR